MELPSNIPKDKDQRYSLDKISNYYGKISHLDRRVGEVLQALQRRGRTDNALVIFAVDHGEYLGSHGRFGKGSFHEESARIPLILRWPSKFRNGQSSQSLISWLDIYATIVQAAWGEQAQLEMGKSLGPLSRDSQFAVHQAVFSEVGSARGFGYTWCTGRNTSGSSTMKWSLGLISLQIPTNCRIWPWSRNIKKSEGT